MTDVNCSPEIRLGSGLPESDGKKSLTVGQEFELTCTGDWNSFEGGKASFQLPEADQYKIHLISMTTAAQQAKLLVTSYVVGEHRLNPLILVSGSEQRSLQGVQFQVGSVLDPKEPPPEAYGPRGPLGISLPWWYHAIWITLVAAIVFAIFNRWRRWSQKRKLIEALEAKSAAQNPFAQFNQSLRKIQRKYPDLSSPAEASIELQAQFLRDLEEAYRVFIGRSFLIPTLDWQDSMILREIKRTEPDIFDQQGPLADQLLREFKKAKEQKQQVKNRDLWQLYELARKNIDGIYLQMSKNQKTKSSWTRGIPKFKKNEQVKGP